MMSTTFDFEIGPPIGTEATLGLIVLQSDETIEHDFRRMLPMSGVALYVSRIASAPEVSSETLAEMEARMPEAAGLLPRPVAFDAVGYGCTSGTSVIGADRIAALVQAGCTTRAVTEPVSALLAACQHLGISRLAFLSPYVEDVSDRLRSVLYDGGISSPVFGTFNEAEETRVARIDGPSILAASQSLMSGADVDALFLSCTNLRTLDVIGQIEAATDKPVLSSNQVLGWDMMRRAGLAVQRPEFGRLFA